MQNRISRPMASIIDLGVIMMVIAVVMTALYLSTRAEVKKVEQMKKKLERLTKEAASLSEQYAEQERQVKKAVSDFNSVTHSLAEQLWTPENDTCQMCGHGGRR